MNPDMSIHEQSNEPCQMGGSGPSIFRIFSSVEVNIEYLGEGFPGTLGLP